jgi:hypothetical protein
MEKVEETITSPPLRDQDEVQFAHDTLGTFLIVDRDYVRENVPEDMRLALFTALDTLCWVLQHDHPSSFVDLLKGVLDVQAERGIGMARGEFRRGPWVKEAS